MNHQEGLLYERVVKILYKKYGDDVSFSDIKECAREWVEKGNKIPPGCVKYFKAYFLKQ